MKNIKKALFLAVIGAGFMAEGVGALIMVWILAGIILSQLEKQRLLRVGALMLGRTDHVGVLRGLIQTRAPLGFWKQKLMADPNRVMEAYLACALDLSAA